MRVLGEPETGTLWDTRYMRDFFLWDQYPKGDFAGVLETMRGEGVLTDDLQRF
jgi:hypothetical protein